jgi:type I restriction enzyme S subunit
MTNAADWEETTLGAEVDLLTGFPFQSEGYTDSEESVRLVRGDNIVQGAMRWEGVKKWPSSDIADYEIFNLREGDVVLAMDRPWIEAGLKYAAISKHDLPCLLVQRTARLRGGPKLYTGYLRYLIGSQEFTQHIHAITTGTAVPHISARQIKEFVFARPPLVVQRSIAAVLGALDDKIELNRRLNATLEAMARALFQSWFIDFDPARAKLDGRPSVGLEPATAALFATAFQDSALGQIPVGWTAGTIEDATSLIIDYRGRTPKKMGSDWSTTGIPAVSAKNVKGGRLVRPDTFNFVSEELYEQWMKDKLALGDILMTSEAPLGELYYLALDARLCLSQRVFAIRANPAVCEPAFLYWWLASATCQTDIINRGTGTTVEGIRQSELRKVSVLLPPLAIQKAAARLLAPWMEQIHRNEEQSRTLAALRDNLMPKLLSGELSVSHELPNA